MTIIQRVCCQSVCGHQVRNESHRVSIIFQNFVIYLILLTLLQQSESLSLSYCYVISHNYLFSCSCFSRSQLDVPSYQLISTWSKNEKKEFKINQSWWVHNLTWSCYISCKKFQTMLILNEKKGSKIKLSEIFKRPKC